jgi:sugar lactone lactonase YvrE
MYEGGWTASVLAAGLSNVECPTLGPDGWILNVCSLSRPEEAWPTRAGDITVTHPERPLETSVLFSTSTDEIEGIPAALAFGPDESIYVADEGRRAIVRVTPSGELDDFITHHQDRRINGPNDLSFDSNGDLYFTDPWTSSRKNPVGAIYGFDWSRQELTLIDSGMEFTNGIVVKKGRLYAAETFTRAIWVYELEGGGAAGNKQLFCRLPDVKNPPMLPMSVRPALGADYVVGPDGIALDTDGNLWVTHYGGSGVFIYGPGGELLAVLPTPGTKPTNLCFGGEALDACYVAVDDPGVIIEYRLGIAGDRLNFCPSRSENHSWWRVMADTSMALPGRRTLPRTEPPTLQLAH